MNRSLCELLLPPVEARLVGFDLFDDDDGVFGSPGTNGTVELLVGASSTSGLPVPTEVFGFVPSDVRFPRLQILSNNGSLTNTQLV